MGTHINRKTTRGLISRAVVTMLAALVVLAGGAAEAPRAQELTDAPEGAGAGVQYSVMIDDGVAVVRPGSGDASPDQAALFERGAISDQWTLSGERAGLSKSNERFSYSVAVSGDLAVVGAEWHDGFRGAAYVLRNDGVTWRVEQQLAPADLGQYDHFGGSVSIRGDYIVVEAAWHNMFRGAAYVFEQVDGVWIERDKIDQPVQERLAAAAEELDVDNVINSGVLALTTLVGQEGDTAPLLPMQDVPEPDSVWATDDTLEDRVVVMWTGVGQDAIVYKVLRDSVLLSVVSSEETQYSDMTGDPAVTYDYCIVVKDMADAESTPKCDTGSRIIFPPITVSASDGDHVDYVRVSWVDISSINTGYMVYRDGDSLGTAGPNQTYYNDDTAAPESLYAYDVAAFDAGGFQSVAVSDSGWRGTILPPFDVAASDGQYLNRVRITWQSQGADTVGHRIYRDDVLIDSTGANVTTYDDVTVAFGATYTYCVAAVILDPVTGIPPAAAANGPVAGESRRVCDDGGTGLSAPGNVAASDSTYDDRIRVTWEDLSDFEDGYEISRSDTAYIQTVVLDTTYANDTSYDDFSALPDSTFIYSVRAVNNLGGVSPDSSDTGYRSIVLAPTDIEATDGEYENRTEITWSCTSTTAVLFKIYRDGAFIKSVSVGNQTYGDYGGTAGQTYDYTVAAVTALEVEAPSLPDPGSRELHVPSLVNASDEEFEDKIVISWTDNSHMENGYLVSRQDTNETVIDTSYAIGPNRGSFTDFSAEPGVTYNYSVAAFDSANGILGYSAPGEDIGWRILLAPTDVEADDGLYETHVNITWTDNSNAEDGYHIYLDTDSIGTVDDNATSFVDSVPGRAGVYHVRAFDLYGESEAASDSGYTIVFAPMSVNASDVYEDRIEVTWIEQSEVEEGYKIYRDEELIETLTDPNVTTYTDTIVATLTGYNDTPGEAFGVTVAGEYAYVADGLSGLHVIDINNPTSPVHVGNYDTPDVARAVAIAGNYACVADDSFLRVIDISDPTNPNLVGSIEVTFSSGAGDVAVSGNHVYVRIDGGLDAIDISNPTNPIRDHFWSLLSGEVPPFDGVAVDGHYVYMTFTIYNDSSLLIFDIQDPSYLAPAGSAVIYDHPTSVAASNGYAYVVSSSAVEIFHVVDPAIPTKVAEYPTSNGRSVAIGADYAYLTDTVSGLQMLDIRDPTSPTFVTSTSTPGQAYDVAVAGRTVYVADGSSGLQVASVSPYPGYDYDYCVRAYYGDFVSNRECDVGVLPAAERFEPETTKLFTKLLANDGASDDAFGFSVSINGDRAVVGAKGKDAATGAAYLFERDPGGTWTQKAKLVASDRATGDSFGICVSIKGDRAIVGASDKDAQTGSAYVFERDAGGVWTQTQKLLASDGGPDDHFGYSISIDGNRVIIGAPRDDDKGAAAGAAYVFEYDTGDTLIQTQKLLASDGAAQDGFGLSVAISGDQAIIGGFLNDDPRDCGSAYIFQVDSGDTLIQTQKLLASDRYNNDYFGYVSISGNRAIVGAYLQDDNGQDAGGAYIFEREEDGSWNENETQILLANDGTPKDYLGLRVSISGNRAIVGAHGEEANDLNTGAAYIFERDAVGTWIQAQKLIAGDGSTGDQFGVWVSIDGERAIIGSFLDDENGLESGSAYVVDAELVAKPYGVAASDGSLASQIRITWDDQTLNERGFRVYRDGEPIANVEPNVEVYEDFGAEPGRTYKYGVATLSSDVSDELEQVTDFGWRPANGSITGRISSIDGGAASGVSVEINPLWLKALLLDGAGGHVSISDTAGTLSFGSGSDFTVEAWFKFGGNGGTGPGDGVMIVKASAGSGEQSYPFWLGNLRSYGEPGRLRFAVSDGDTTIDVSSDSTGFNDDSWHHLACVHEAAQNEVRMYVDGVFQGATLYTRLGDITNTDFVTIGAGRIPGSWFGGQIDEIRIWSAARDSMEILSAMHEQLEGDEDGLVCYWPLDWRGTDVITDVTDGAHYGEIRGGVYWTDDSVPLDIYPVTDDEGSYVFKDIYYGTEATFKLIPFEGNRQFDPVYKMISLTTESPVENQVDFIDVSIFKVSGVVRYKDTGCAAEDVAIMVDSKPAGSTDKNGKFEVEAPLGERSIRPDLEGHTFEPDSITMFVEDDVSINDSTGVAFRDLKTYTLSGRVGGGCGRPVGEVMITIRSQNDCYQETFTVVSDSTSYSKMLPPQKYLVSAAVVDSTIPDGLSKTDVVMFFQNLGERMAELDSLNVVMDFVYRAPLRVAITGFDEYVESCVGPLTFENRTLPDNLPAVPQLTDLFLNIEVYEDYGSGGLCPLDSGTVTIYDELWDRQNNPFELEVRDGVAVCTTFASTPSLVVGRVDEQGNDRSFQKAINAVVAVEGRAPVTATEWALVTGHVAPEGADFVTGIADMPLYVLRDPPGDDSYAFLEEGHESRTRIYWDKRLTSWQAGVHVEGWWGVKTDWFIGFMGGVEFEVEGKATFETDWLFGTQHYDEWSTDLTYKVTKQFATSANDVLTGSGGDVFVGAGYNFIFSEVGVIDVQDCEVIKSVSVGFQPDSIATVYAYTEQYISAVLIPELAAKDDYYTGLGKADSAAIFAAKQRGWEDALAHNNFLKAGATTVNNRSFSAGADFTYTQESGVTRSYQSTATFVMDGKGSIGGFEIGTPVMGFVFSILANVHHEDLLSSTDTTGTTTSTVGYTLSDDDIGDHFTVDIKNDGEYPSPVFDVLAGVSSCPYEPWADSSGAARMMPRDKPELSISPKVRSDIPPDEPAVFTVNLSNLSPTEESRLYVLRLLTASNPYGAIVKVGGVPVSTGSQQYFIDPGQTQQATLTVERGPNRYTYNDLEFIIYPPCEYSLWEDGGPLQQAVTYSVSVTFEAPCSDVTLLYPETGWKFTESDQDLGQSIDLWLTDYELQISESPVDTLQKVGGEYRRLGYDGEGPTTWEYILDRPPGADQTIISWYPDTLLQDGVYELRGYTECEGGRGYSEVSTGTIERHGPLVVGAPEPADGELSLGEEISITFNELIDCDSVDSVSVELFYLDGPDSSSAIALETSCDGRTVFIAPTANANDLEGRRLQARVTGVTDRAGNPMPGPVTWEFVYRQSQFTWSQLVIASDVPYRDPGVVTGELVNGTGEPVEFTMSSPPWWITSVTPSSGTILPGGRQAVSFAIRDTLVSGVYETEVTATAADAGQGVAVCDIYITVSCHEPVWAFDPSRFEHTMTMVAELDIGGALSTDQNDRVAAFVGNELRGVANVDSVPGLLTNPNVAFLTIYSNRASGERVRYQVWDDSACKLYNSTAESDSFVVNKTIGSALAPRTLTATEVQITGTLEIAVNEGWTWISTNMLSADMSVTGVLSDLLSAEGDIVKSQTAFSQFVADSTGWSGTLSEVDNVSGYMLKLSAPGTILHTGDSVSTDSLIPVVQGWNWISYLPQAPMTVFDALADLDTRGHVDDGDVVKSQGGFAEFQSHQWYGSLDVMEPGKGYKLRLASAVDDGFNYPPSGSSAPVPLVAAADDGDGEASSVESAPSWSVNHHAYEHNMTVTAVLRVGGMESIDENDLVGAFVGDDCRGVSRPVYVEGVRRHEVFLMVCSNEAAGEKVTLRAFDADATLVYDVTETLTFEADKVEGSVQGPVVFNAGSVREDGGQDVPNKFALAQNYPNPFNPKTMIGYDVPAGGGHVTLRIYDVGGRLVRTLVDGAETPGRKTVTWEGRNNRGQQVATGVYFYRMTAPGFEKTRKMIMIK
jgi:hypothetical protein